MRVFVTRRLPLDPRVLAPRSIEVDVSPHDRPLTGDEIAAEAPDADGLISMLSDPLDAALLARLPKLRVIANYAVGVNNVDLAAARARGIVVCNTPDVLTAATADLAMTLILMLARRTREAERRLRTGGYDGWGPELLLGASLDGRTLGVVGLGRIGAAVAHRARAFGMRIAYASPRESAAAAGLGAERLALDELLGRADVVSVHAPLTAETRHLIDARALGRMRRSAILINTARGPLVDEAALADALESCGIAGAGLDVFEREPELHPRLAGRDDVVLLPHVGSATRETREAMARLAIEDCFAVLQGRPPKHRI